MLDHSIPAAPIADTTDFHCDAALGGLAEDDGELGWQERALCSQTDPEAFFPEKGGSTKDAKRICARCEVKAECLEYALRHDERVADLADRLEAAVTAGDLPPAAAARQILDAFQAPR